MGPRLSAAALVAATILTATGLALPQEGRLHLLPLSEVVARLPAVGAEWLERGTGKRTLDPFSAELERRLAEGAQLTDEQWRSALLDTGVLRARTTWPADEPFALSLRRPAWLGEFVLVLRPERDDLELAPVQLGTFYRGSCGNPVIAAASRALHQAIGRLPLGTHVLPFRLELLRPPPGPERGALDLWLVEDYLESVSGGPRTPRGPRPDPPLPVVVTSAELALFVEVVPALDTVLPPASSPELDRAVGDTLHLALPDRGEAWLGASGILAGHLPGLARSLRIEIFEGPELREVVTLHPTAAQNPFGAQSDGVRVLSIPRALALDPRASENWSVRVQGVSEGVLRSWGCDRRWSGTLELTLDELIERGSRRPCWR